MILLVFGANVNALNSQLKTPLDLCLDCGTFLHQQCLKMSDNIKKMDEMAALLKKYDGLAGKECTSAHTSAVQKKATERFVCFSEDEDEGRLLVGSQGVGSQEGLVSDWWYADLAEMYYTSWMNVRSNSSFFCSCCHLDEATTFGIHVRKMQLMQMAGSRILVLDGGGMKGLVELETLDQIEKSTGRKIIELFDWMVGTSTGALIVLALVHGIVVIFFHVFFVWGGGGGGRHKQHLCEPSTHSIWSFKK